MIDANINGKNIISNAQGILLTNGLGGFFFFTLKPYSKYCGNFFYNGKESIKTVESIGIDKEEAKILYNGQEIEVLSKEGREKYFFPKEFNALVYSNETNKRARFVFDCREAYDFSNWGRNYELFIEEGVIVLKYTKTSDKRENNKEYEVYCAIALDKIDYQLNDKWIERYYEFDEKRNDNGKLWVYDSFSFTGKKAVIASAQTKEEAINTAKKIFKESEKIRKQQKDEFEYYENNGDLAYNLSRIALDSLIVQNLNSSGIFAGLPWFFQFWTRDSAFSTKALMIMKKNDFVKDLLMRYLNFLRQDGLLPNILPQGGLDSIDGVGIVFHRIGELLNFIDSISEKEMSNIYNKLESSVRSMLTYHSADGLIISNPCETWMDTDLRAGARIEIQSLFLSMLSLMLKLSKKMNNTEGQKFAEKLIKEMISKVRKNFFNNGMLYDGLNDCTIRPNVFIAYYFYPELFNNDEWEKIFDNALGALWLDWGGVATIDKKDGRFRSNHSGISNSSYHNGDSWYFINNLVGICLNRLNKEKYKKYIENIKKSSSFEILNSGIFGYHAELSSASKLESTGCLAQAWSSAMYIELIDELKNNK